MKNYVERVTNLERTQVEYVPKKLITDFINDMRDCVDDCVSASDIKTSFEDIFSEYQKQIPDESVKLYELDVYGQKKVTFERPIGICPYCGGEMRVRINYRPFVQYRDRNRYPLDSDGDIAFKCAVCGATTPRIYMNERMLDENIVAKEINNFIEDAIVNYEDEKEMGEI